MKKLFAVLVLITAGCAGAKQPIKVDTQKYATEQDVRDNLSLVYEGIMNEVIKSYRGLDKRLTLREEGCPCK